jgi:hypothetical protein
MGTIPREQWEGELKALKCRQKKKDGKQPPCVEWWETDWGYSFPVSIIVPPGDVDPLAFSELLTSIVHMRTVRYLGKH